jgi:hypothetical protein
VSNPTFSPDGKHNPNKKKTINELLEKAISEKSSVNYKQAKELSLEYDISIHKTIHLCKKLDVKYVPKNKQSPVVEGWQKLFPNSYFCPEKTILGITGISFGLYGLSSSAGMGAFFILAGSIFIIEQFMGWSEYEDLSVFTSNPTRICKKCGCEFEKPSLLKRGGASLGFNSLLFGSGFVASYRMKRYCSSCRVR